MNSSSIELQKAYNKLATTILEHYTNPKQWYVGVTPDICNVFGKLRMSRNSYDFIEVCNEEEAMMIAELLITNLVTSRSSIKYSGRSTWVYAYLREDGDENFESNSL